MGRRWPAVGLHCLSSAVLRPSISCIRHVSTSQGLGLFAPRKSWEHPENVVTRSLSATSRKLHSLIDAVVKLKVYRQELGVGDGETLEEILGTLEEKLSKLEVEMWWLKLNPCQQKLDDFNMKLSYANIQLNSAKLELFRDVLKRLDEKVNLATTALQTMLQKQETNEPHSDFLEYLIEAVEWMTVTQEELYQELDEGTKENERIRQKFMRKLVVHFAGRDRAEVDEELAGLIDSEVSMKMDDIKRQEQKPNDGMKSARNKAISKDRRRSRRPQVDRKDDPPQNN